MGREIDQCNFTMQCNTGLRTMSFYSMGNGVSYLKGTEPSLKKSRSNVILQYNAKYNVRFFLIVLMVSPLKRHDNYSASAQKVSSQKVFGHKVSKSDSMCKKSPSKKLPAIKFPDIKIIK